MHQLHTDTSYKQAEMLAIAAAPMIISTQPPAAVLSVAATTPMTRGVGAAQPVGVVGAEYGKCMSWRGVGKCRK